MPFSNLVSSCFMSRKLMEPSDSPIRLLVNEQYVLFSQPPDAEKVIEAYVRVITCSYSVSCWSADGVSMLLAGSTEKKIYIAEVWDPELQYNRMYTYITQANWDYQQRQS